MKIVEGSYLVGQKIKVTSDVVSQPGIVNRIIILDGSGSMGWTIEALKNDVISRCELMSPDDTVSVGYFSSAGQFGWICKGSSPKLVGVLLKPHRFPLNMTCYSDILGDVETLIEDLTPVSKTFSLLFFSDGYPNQKTDSILTLVNKFSSKLSSAMIIGYGDLYGRDLLANMAEAMKGVLVHSSNLSEFSRHLDSFSNNNVGGNKILFDVPPDAKEALVAVSANGDVVSYPLTARQVMLNADANYVFYISNKKQSPKLSGDEMLQGIYAVSRALLQAGKYTEAVDVLAISGDKNFIDKASNSFTVAEYGAVENALLASITDTSLRFAAGKDLKYLPKADAFCMLDLAELLEKDQTAKFLPYHPAFEYKRIGRATVQNEEAPKFSASKDVSCPTSLLVWNQKRLNLGVKAKIPGTISLDGEAPKVGLDQLFSTYIWRTYNIINDGKLNVTKLPLKDVSQDTLEVLRRENIVESENDTVILDLTRIPVINRKIADSYINLDKITPLLIEENLLEVAQKTYKYLYSAFSEELREGIEDLVKPTSFNDVQVEYLKKFFVEKDGSFNPDTTKAEPTDFYFVKEFVFGIKGLNTIPAIAEVLEKAASSGKLSAMQKLIVSSHDLYSMATANQSQEQKALWLKENIDQVRRRLSLIRSEINKAKFAAVLSKKNFIQVPVLKEVNLYEADGHTFEIKVKDVEVKI